MTHPNPIPGSSADLSSQRNFLSRGPTWILCLSLISALSAAPSFAGSLQTAGAAPSGNADTMENFAKDARAEHLRIRKALSAACLKEFRNHDPDLKACWKLWFPNPNRSPALGKSRAPVAARSDGSYADNTKILPIGSAPAVGDKAGIASAASGSLAN